MTGEINHGHIDAVAEKPGKERLRLVPFRREHLERLRPRGFAAGSRYSLIDLAPSLLCRAQLGPAFTALLDGDAAAVAGVCHLCDGIGEAWALVSPEVERVPISFHRAVSRRLARIGAENGFRRLLASVDVNDPRGMRWLEMLGFRRAGLMEAFGPHGENLYRYVKESGS